MELKQILNDLDKSNKALVDSLRNYSSVKEIFLQLNDPGQTGVGRLHSLDKEFFETNFKNVSEMYEAMSENCVNFDHPYIFWYRGVITSTNEVDYWERVEYNKLEIIWQYAKENNFQDASFIQTMSNLEFLDKK